MKNKLLTGLFFLFLSYWGYGQTITVNISPPDAPICSGEQVVLTATASGGTAPYTYLWSTGETSDSISVNKALTYTVFVRDQLGNTGQRDVIVRAATKPNSPTAVNESGLVCPGGSARLVASAPGGIYQWFDVNFQHKFTGAVYNTDAITQNTVFYVQTTIDGCPSSFTPVPVIVIENPVVNRASVCSGSAATFIASGADTYQWYDAAGNLLPSTGATFVTGPLTQNTSFFVTGTTNGCISQKVEAIAEVKAVTPAPNGGGPYVVCFGSNITLSASGVNGVVFDWFDQETGGTSIISSPDFTTPILTADKTYWVQTTLNGCPSVRVRVNITVSQPPLKPNATSNGPICYNTPAVLSVSNPQPGVVYKWYTSLTSTVYRTGADVTTEPLLSDRVFYVRAETGGGACVSDAEAVPVVVKGPVVAPTVSGATAICAGTTTLTATAPVGTIFNWYETLNSSTGTPGAVFSPTVNTSRSYFVSVTTADGCESARTEVVITIIPPPAAPQATDVNTCLGETAVLVATTGNSHRWYASATGGAPLWSGSVFETPALTATTNYFVATVGPNGCESLTRKRVRAIVIAKPNRPAASGPGSAVCPGSAPTLTASGSTGTYRWWSEEVGGDFLGGSAIITPTVNATKTFWVEAVTPQGCASDRRPVPVNVTTVVNPQFLYSSGTYCTSGANPTPTKFIPGSFSSTAGLSITASTGRINLAASTPGAYIVTFTPSSAVCNTPSSVVISISNVPDAQFTYPQNEYCSDDANPLPIFPTGASAGVFSSSAGLVFRNATTGQINLEASTPGTYTVFNTITTDCGTSQRPFDITIRQRAIVSAGPNRTVPAGGEIQLAGSVNLGLGVTWTSSNPADFFSNPNSLTPTYRPAATSGTVTLTLTTDNPPGLCGPRTDQVVITIATKPNAPTAAPQTICYNEKATLSATAPGGAYKWYAQATGGAAIGTGANFTSPDPLIADAFFYVTTTINGIESDRTEVPVTVRAQLDEPAVTGGGLVCRGVVPLNITDIAEEYRWYDAAGDLKSTLPNFNPTVTQNTTFWAEIVIGNCVSPRHRVDITVKPTTNVNSAPTGEVCSGSPQNYTISAADLSATFTYSRAVVTGISNAEAVNVSASQITEPLFNTTTTEKIVTYVITPYLDGCPGTPFNYIVTVLPTPAIKSALLKTVCNRESVAYFVEITPNVTNYFTWSRAAVSGISNAAISGQQSRNIQESLENTTNLPIEVEYTFSYGTTTCPGEPFTLTVTVNPAVYVTNTENVKFVCAGEPVNYEIASNVDGLGATFKWVRVNNLPGQPKGTDYTFSKNINEILFNNSTASLDAYYRVIPMLNGCEGTPFDVHIIVKPQVQKPVIKSNSPVCLDKDINLFTDFVSGAKYIWTSSAGLNQQNDAPFLNIPATTAGRVSYRVTVVVGDCSNVSDNIDVDVNQKPVANAGANQTVCPEVTRIPLNGQAFGGLTGGPIEGRWTIVKGSGTFKDDENLKANAYLPSAADRTPGAEPVVLSFQSANDDDCEPAVSLVTFTFDRVSPSDTEAERILTLCSGGEALYEIVTTGDAAPGITYAWMRTDDPLNIGTSKIIKQTLINNGTTDRVFIYQITPSLNGCVGKTFELRVAVKPAIPKLAFTAPATICVNKPITLTHPGSLPNARYFWTGPDGVQRETNVPTYTFTDGITTPGPARFNLSIRVGDCEVASNARDVVITPVPVINAGADMPYCPNVTNIPLHGVVTRGVNGPASAGKWAILSGKGQFANAADVLDNTYQVHPDDLTTGSIVLQLQSTDNCDGVTPDIVTFTFQQIKVANAGPDREACEQRVQLNGQILAASGTGRWTGGGGTFVDGNTSLNGVYIPSPAEVAAHSVTLTLIADDNSPCNQLTDDVVITLLPPPTVTADASLIRYVVTGKTITLNPIVSEDNLIYSWIESPAVGSINNPSAKNPVITGKGVDVTYTVTVTNPLLCTSATSQVLVRVSPQITTVNTFTPNADGINDTWIITGAEAYSKMVVDIYSRAGQQVYHSVGYSQPWDGTSNGKPVPFGVYYFVIDTREVEQKVTGYVTVVR